MEPEERDSKLKSELNKTISQGMRLVKLFSRLELPNKKNRSDVLEFVRNMDCVHNTAISIWDRFETIGTQMLEEAINEIDEEAQFEEGLDDDEDYYEFD